MIAFFESWKFVGLLFVLVFGSWAIGLWSGLFYTYLWLDIPYHFAGGLLVFVIAWVAFSHFNIEISGGAIANFIVFLSIVALVGVLWEFTEFIADRYFIQSGLTYRPGIYEDTLADFVFDLLGGAFGFMIYETVFLRFSSRNNR